MSRSSRYNETPLAFAETGFGSYEQPPYPPAGHIHDEVEISAFKNGSVTMLYGGRPVTIAPDRLIVHWGMLPHQVVSRDPGALVVGLHIPLVWILQWELPSSLMGRLLNLDLLIEAHREVPCSDLRLLEDWCHLLMSHFSEADDIVLSEVRGRLLRIAHTQSSSSAVDLAPPETGMSHVFDRALALIATRFREPLRVSDISDAAGISPRHMARLFRQHTGQTINAYITRFRVSHAQHLLLVTDRKIVDIMNDAGFSCSTHFYKAFRERAGCSPREYRLRYPGPYRPGRFPSSPS